jgi:glyoxylase-like metal-dependent hydrolase (beta-lactamase superfamily II)
MYRKTITIALFLFLSFNSFAQQDGANKKEEYYAKKKKMMEIPSPTSINQIEDGNSKLINILPGVYYFEGDHNMGVYLVEDKFTLIDTQEEDNMDRNLNIIKRINKKASIKYLISTSNVLKALKTVKDLKKEGVLLISQRVTRKSQLKRKVSGESGFSGSFKPDFSFTEQLNLNIETKTIEITSISNEGNSLVYLPNENVLFTGAIYTHKKYPHLDYENGITLGSMLENISKIGGFVDENTLVVPGKGTLANALDLINYQKVMTKITKQIVIMIKNGDTLETVLAKKSITNNLDSRGFGDGSVTTEMFLTSLYEELTYELGPVDTRSPEERAMERLKEMQKNKEKKN